MAFNSVSNSIELITPAIKLRQRATAGTDIASLREIAICEVRVNSPCVSGTTIGAFCAVIVFLAVKLAHNPM